MIRDEIHDCMSDFCSNGNGSASALFVFPQTFTGFRGHFPDNPVLPGLCIVQAALELVAESRKKRPHLKEMINVKFFAVTKPEAKLLLKCHLVEGDPGEDIIKATVSENDTKVAQLSLRVGYAR